MKSMLVMLVPLYLSIIIIVHKLITNYSKNKTISFDYSAGLVLILCLTIFLSYQQIKSYNFQRNIDAVFANFKDCSASIKFDSNSKPSSPFLVESCGKQFSVYVEKGKVQKVLSKQ